MDMHIFILCFLGLAFLTGVLLIISSRMKANVPEGKLVKNTTRLTKWDRKYDKTKFGRCQTSVGRYGYDASNPICVRGIYDKCLDDYLYNMLYKGSRVSEYIIVSDCRCENINKPVYKFAIKCNNGVFLTLFFLEDNTTIPRFYPLECEDNKTREIFRNGNFTSLKKDYWKNLELFIPEYRQPSMPILKENFFSVFPQRRDNETQEAFDKRMQSAIKKKQFLDEYLAFTKRERNRNSDIIPPCAYSL